VAPEARSARNDDVRELSRTLARAFYDDPVMVWLLPDEKPQTAQLYRLFATMTRHHHLARGGVEVACDGPDLGAAALWDPPNEWQETRWAQLAMTPTFIRVFGSRSMRGRAVQELMKRVHPEEPHWYLAAIGSDPTVRGQGFGQALMRSRLERCDAEYCPAYSNPRSLKMCRTTNVSVLPSPANSCCPTAARQCGRCGGHRGNVSAHHLAAVSEIAAPAGDTDGDHP
jgi:GNAT superfamily N-acetyltransferase